MITWTWYPSLEFCCKKKKIELLYLEQTTFRPDTYRIKLGYFQFYDKYNNDKMDESYEEFMSQNKNQTFFNRKELLSLFLSKENLHIIKQMEEPPQYEFGVSIGPDWDPLAQGHCQMNEKRILTKLKEIVKKENISLRTHPAGRKKTEELEGYALDHSKDALEWIIKNKRIASIGSNVNFETMLVGRTAYNLGNNFPYRKGSVCTLDQLEEKVCDISYLNFIIFGYYAPYDLMFNKDYILWRLSNPSITEIYEYNLKHIITNSMKLNESFLKMPVCDRLEFILKEYQKLEPTEIDNLLNHPVIDKDQVIKTLEQELEQSKNEYEKIIHSKSWKITKPLRWITNRIK